MCSVSFTGLLLCNDNCDLTDQILGLTSSDEFKLFDTLQRAVLDAGIGAWRDPPPTLRFIANLYGDQLVTQSCGAAPLAALFGKDGRCFQPGFCFDLQQSSTADD